MPVIRGYIRLILCVLGLSVGVQIPGVVDRYRQFLTVQQGVLEQALADIAEGHLAFPDSSWREQIYQYSLSADEEYQQQLASMQDQLTLKEALAMEAQALGQQPLPAFGFWVWQAQPDWRQQAWDEHDFAVVLNGASLVWGGGMAVLLLLLGELLFWPLRRAMPAAVAQPQVRPKATPSR